jgi:translation initiation factor 4E
LGIKPEWEDENCIDGGKWAIRAPKDVSTKHWENLLLALVGDQFFD